MQTAAGKRIGRILGHRCGGVKCLTAATGAVKPAGYNRPRERTTLVQFPDELTEEVGKDSVKVACQGTKEILEPKPGVSFPLLYDPAARDFDHSN